MPIYTVRSNMIPNPENHRGGGVIVLDMHFSFISDGAALEDFPEFVDKWTNSPLADRWTVARGTAIHELVLYRRSIEIEKSWVRLGSLNFSLANFESVTIPVGVAIEFTGTPVYAHNRGAVLVRQIGDDHRAQRRIYVGPVSPIYLRGESSTLAGAIPVTLGVPSLTGDDPPHPNDSVDRWRVNIMEHARDWVADIGSDLTGGHPVVISWQHGLVEAVASVTASPVRAEVRSRGIRAAMSDDSPYG